MVEAPGSNRDLRKRSKHLGWVGLGSPALLCPLLYHRMNLFAIGNYTLLYAGGEGFIPGITQSINLSFLFPSPFYFTIYHRNIVNIISNSAIKVIKIFFHIRVSIDICKAEYSAQDAD